MLGIPNRLWYVQGLLVVHRHTRAHQSVTPLPKQCLVQNDCHPAHHPTFSSRCAGAMLVSNLETVRSTYSSSSSLPGLASFRIGILIPCCAKHLLRLVDSITPGNFLAL